mmetsp:Transcript_19444/g.29226  ORF Transcript_19444/g.29226 Transcript_19444/m.29226 type:complete len:664 (+) Transcript_19444:136-2127(+)|eukprot:CAMPEP_0178908550 /NCGR_PEP_ID=MMETSP0786-20121207/7983_1 /TAXON_ID=186022 /ORGANISM="Thalassionema frauenfeldii, Strain CCMP 1798" /LENGTH=663 /DNA_ID=CAMNT_0020580461 /DNA_START=50 /DNA_END=2041 /DNA_ORIENTATION=+
MPLSVSTAEEGAASPRSTIRNLSILNTNNLPSECGNNSVDPHLKSLSRFDPLMNDSITQSPPRKRSLRGSMPDFAMSPTQGEVKSSNFQESHLTTHEHRRVSSKQPESTDLAANMSERIKTLGSTSLASHIQPQNITKTTRNGLALGHRRSSTGGLSPMKPQIDFPQSENTDLAANMSDLIKSLGSTSLGSSIPTPNKAKRMVRPNRFRSNTESDLPVQTVNHSLARPHGHRKSKSGVNIGNEINADGIVRSNPPEGSSNPHTPNQSPRSSMRSVKSITPSKLLRNRSNSKLTNTTPTFTPREVLPAGQSMELNLPLFAKPSPTSFLNTSDCLALRTSEQDPSAHQIELPGSEELLTSAKLCNLVSFNRSESSNFDLMSIVGVPNLALKEFVISGQATAGLTEHHRPIVKQLLECGEGITVGGCATRTAEVVTFEVPSRSQIVVVFRGNEEQQLKPIKRGKKHFTVEEFHPDQKVDVNSEFKEAYFELESVFSAMVDKLTETNPFAQVVFCGHSFGGALATMAGVRYACNRPTMRVSVHVSGCPRVGAKNFRQLANSLSNLRIIRVELKNDPLVDSPADGTTKWHHVGHSISVGKGSMVMAYRFDRNRPPTTNSIFRKNDKNSKAYCLALEACASKKQWFVGFSGEDFGDGVKGKDDEGRHIS